MKKETFEALWDNFVVLYLESPESHMLHDAYASGRLRFSGNAATIVYKKYCKIKSVFKSTYYSDQDYVRLDRHKTAAIITYAFVDTYPVSIEDIQQYDSLFLKLANECIAFYFGLHYLTIDYTPESINRIINDRESVFFRLPKTCFPSLPLQNPSDEYGYIAAICKDLFFSKKLRNFNILTMANVFFLLESGFCNLTPSELYDDVKPVSKIEQS